MTPRAERVTINKEFASVEEFIHEYVTNVSRSGAFIRSRDPLPVGTFVNLKFTVILDELETIEGIGEVVRVAEAPPGMGVVFRELTAHSQQLLSRLITREPTDDAVTGARRSAPSVASAPGAGAAGAPSSLSAGGDGEAEEISDFEEVLDDDGPTLEPAPRREGGAGRRTPKITERRVPPPPPRRR